METLFQKKVVTVDDQKEKTGLFLFWLQDGKPYDFTFINNFPPEEFDNFILDRINELNTSDGEKVKKIERVNPFTFKIEVSPSIFSLDGKNTIYHLQVKEMEKNTFFKNVIAFKIQETKSHEDYFHCDIYYTSPFATGKIYLPIEFKI